MKTKKELFTHETNNNESPSRNNMDLSFYTSQTLILSRKIFIQCISFIALLLFIFSILGQFYRYFFNAGQERYITHFFNLDKENNIPTYFTSVLLLLNSALTLLIAATNRKIKVKYSRNWYLISLLLFIMSMDEILMLHEQLSTPIRNLLHTQGFFYFAWLLPALFLIILFLIININLFFNLPSKYQKKFFIATFIYLIGAFLMEMLGGKFLSFYGQNNIGYAIVTNIEESFELVGIILLLNTLLSYFKEELPNISLKLD